MCITNLKERGGTNQMENVYFQLQELMMTLLDVVKGEFEWCVPKTLKYICEHY
jgi:hypothetical protein